MYPEKTDTKVRVIYAKFVVDPEVSHEEWESLSIKERAKHILTAKLQKNGHASKYNRRVAFDVADDKKSGKPCAFYHKAVHYDIIEEDCYNELTQEVFRPPATNYRYKSALCRHDLS